MCLLNAASNNATDFTDTTVTLSARLASFGGFGSHSGEF
jgi:hypothetical protein